MKEQSAGGRPYTQAPRSAVKTSGDVQQKENSVPKDEVLISRTAPSGREADGGFSGGA